jgi:hypothetical protein
MFPIGNNHSGWQKWLVLPHHSLLVTDDPGTTMGDCTGMMGTKICSIHGLIILKRWKTTPLMMTTSYPFVAVWSVTITVITQDPLCRTNQQIKGTTPLFDPEPQDYTLAYTQYIYIYTWIYNIPFHQKSSPLPQNSIWGWFSRFGVPLFTLPFSIYFNDRCWRCFQTI